MYYALRIKVESRKDYSYVSWCKYIKGFSPVIDWSTSMHAKKIISQTDWQTSV